MRKIFAAVLFLILAITIASSASPVARVSPPVTDTCATPGACRFVGAGDIAASNSGDTTTSNRVIALNPDAVFTTGDNAYDSGTPTQFTNYYNPTWGRYKAKTYPTPGNHDYKTSGAIGYFGYFGVDSYYHTKIGNWDIYGLNSNIARSATSPQVVWLKKELSSNPNSCVLAMWHHPRYSSGTNHGSNTSVQPFIDALATANADIVLNGHEHNYERFAPSKMKGIREFVVGTGGVGAGYPFGTPLSGSEKRIKGSLGVLELTLKATGYDWRFVAASTGNVLDSGSGTC